jgi:spermidine synthase
MPEPTEVRPVTHVTAEVVVITVLLATLSREVLFRAPHAYLSPLELSPLAVPLAVSFGLGLGATLALVGPGGAGRAARSLTLAGAAAALLPWCFRWSFALAASSPLPLLLTVALAGASVANPAVACARWLARDARDLGVAVDLLSPSRLAQSAILLAIALAAAANLPALHAGAVLGVCLAITSLTPAPLARFLSAREQLPERWQRPVAFLTLFGAAGSALLAERTLPLAEAGAFAGQVVMTAGGTRQRIALVSFGSHFEIYVDRALRLSTLDQERYPEALVQPAQLAVPEAKQVLLLGGGLGLVERELLRSKSLTSLTVIATDRALAELAASAPWPGTRARGALRDPRANLIEAEPAVFVDRSERHFDLVVVDADDPIGYREAKHFTRHFYRSVAALLTPNGVMVAQLPSPLTFPEAHASVLATLAAAGLDVSTYRAALPALGEWGFAVASKRDSSEVLTARILGARANLPAGLRYVTPENLDGLFARPRDLPAARRAGSTLADPSIVELYARENALRQ